MYGLKAGKSPGVDSIPFELLKNGGEATTTITNIQIGMKRPSNTAVLGTVKRKTVNPLTLHHHFVELTSH